MDTRKVTKQRQSVVINIHELSLHHSRTHSRPRHNSSRMLSKEPVGGASAQHVAYKYRLYAYMLHMCSQMDNSLITSTWGRSGRNNIHGEFQKACAVA